MTEPRSIYNCDGHDLPFDAPGTSGGRGFATLMHQSAAEGGVGARRKSSNINRLHSVLS